MPEDPIRNLLVKCEHCGQIFAISMLGQGASFEALFALLTQREPELAGQPRFEDPAQVRSLLNQECPGVSTPGVYHYIRGSYSLSLGNGNLF